MLKGTMETSRATWLCGLVLLAGSLVSRAACSSDLRAFDDSILFKITWSNQQDDGSGFQSDEAESVLMTSANNEKYRCTLPISWGESRGDSATYKGPNPLQLLSPLFTQMSCSYRLDTYWTYELCHGRFIRQYHEEREGRKVKLQEYFLGKWSKEERDKYDEELEHLALLSDASGSVTVPFRRIEGINMPYLQINMSDGTLCDLSGRPRMSHVLYVCYQHGKHEIYSLDEVSTCEYEIVVLSPYLCRHPRYRPQESNENEVRCVAQEGSPTRPRSLMELEAESLKLRHENLLQDLEALEARIKGEGWPLEIQLEALEETAGTTQPAGGGGGIAAGVGAGMQGSGAGSASAAAGSTASSQMPTRLDIHPPPKPTLDERLIQQFLEGTYCLSGGSGWWKYELCYGRVVQQFHEDKDGRRSTIVLGEFNWGNHEHWLERNPHKRPKPRFLRKFVYHYYSEGAECDVTGRPRQVEVKLKCMDKAPTAGTSNPSSSGAVALYLLEPRTCEYVLGVEAPFLCPLIERADDFGLFVAPSRSAQARLDLEENEEEEEEAEEDTLAVVEDDV